MSLPRRHAASLLLAAPGVLCLVVLLVLPLTMIACGKSAAPCRGPRSGAPGVIRTPENYAELLTPTYALYFFDTFRIGFIACAFALVFAYPVAHLIANEVNSTRRRLYVTFFVTMMFLSVLARVYSIALTFSPVGFLRPVSAWLGLNPNGRAMTEVLVVMEPCTSPCRSLRCRWSAPCRTSIHDWSRQHSPSALPGGRPTSLSRFL